MLAVFALLIGTLAYFTTKSLLIQQVEDQARATIRAELTHIQGMLQLLLRTDNLTGARNVVASFGVTPGHQLTILTDAEGVILASTRLDLVGTKWTDITPPLDQVLIANLATSGSTAVHLSKDTESLSGYAEVCGMEDTHVLRPHQCGFLYAHSSIHRTKAAAVTALRRQAVQHAVGLVVLAGILWGILHLKATRRIERLITTTQRFTAGDITARAGLQGHDELACLGQAFDTMAQTIADDHTCLEEANRQLAQQLAERQRAEKALRESEERFRSIVEASIQGMYIHQDGIIQFANPALAAMFGYEQPQDLIGQPYQVTIAEPE